LDKSLKALGLESNKTELLFGVPTRIREIIQKRTTQIEKDIEALERPPLADSPTEDKKPLEVGKKGAMFLNNRDVSVLYSLTQPSPQGEGFHVPSVPGNTDSPV
jgi:hypothetical protein